jgi:hypothetical protein
MGGHDPVSGPRATGGEKIKHRPTVRKTKPEASHYEIFSILVTFYVLL